MLGGSRKEIAENLMIVDLIRHDLHNAVGELVECSKFCGVEEYETVWQLVSVLEGSLPKGTAVEVDDSLGWEVLRRSLPPGMFFSAFISLGTHVLIRFFRLYDWCPEETFC
jgi:para-aminobenzoate synthetase